jgi:Flp pilus assembly pilin Flp
MKQGLKHQRGQALVEYAVIAAAVLLAFVSATLLTQQLLSANMGDTMRGLDTPSKLPPSLM